MLSEFIPIWLPGVFSPLQNLIQKRVEIPRAWKPVTLFAFVAAAIVIVSLMTPMGIAEIPEQVVALWGIVIAGYGAAVVTPKIGAKAAAVLVVGVGVLAAVGSVAYAQTAPTINVATAAEATANVWLGWLFGYIGGNLGRLFR